MNVAPNYADFPPAVFDLLQRQLAASGRIGATRWYQTSDIPTVASNTLSAPTPINFTMGGIVLAMYGQTNSPTAANYAGMAVRVQIGGTEDLILDGQGSPTFMPFLGAFGGVNNWMSVMRRVYPGTNWLFQFNNTSANTQIPKVVLSFISDADVAAMAKGQR